ncbi:MAG: nucleotidyltransferase domain-containing protein [Candidatus Methanodesulfokora sp.]
MEVYVEILMRRAEMVRNWREHARAIAEAARSVLPGSKIYVFGSVVRGESTGGSDVDILIVSNEVPESNLERARMKVMIEERLGLPLYHPFELHLVKEEEAKLYFKRIKEFVEL